CHTTTFAVAASAPTAQTSSVACAEIARRLAVAGVAGTAMLVHAVPSQCSMNGNAFVPSVVEPTAHTSFAATAATAAMVVPPAPATTLHAVPSQCSSNALTVSFVVDEPPAHTSVDATVATASSVLLVSSAAAGVGTTDHDAPS